MEILCMSDFFHSFSILLNLHEQGKLPVWVQSWPLPIAAIVLPTIIWSKETDKHSDIFIWWDRPFCGQNTWSSSKSSSKTRRMLQFAGTMAILRMHKCTQHIQRNAIFLYTKLEQNKLSLNQTFSGCSSRYSSDLKQFRQNTTISFNKFKAIQIPPKYVTT